MSHDLSVYEKLLKLQAGEFTRDGIMYSDEAVDRIQRWCRSQFYGAAYDAALDLRVYDNSWVSVGTTIHKAIERKHRDEGDHPYWFVQLQISCGAFYTKQKRRTRVDSSAADKDTASLGEGNSARDRR